jgi:hypothetical protein
MGRTGSLHMGSAADECKKSPRIGVCTMSTSACAVLKEHILDAIPQCKEVMQRGRRAAGERRSSSITARPLKGFETGPPRGEREGVLPPDLIFTRLTPTIICDRSPPSHGISDSRGP